MRGGPISRRGRAMFRLSSGALLSLALLLTRSLPWEVSAGSNDDALQRVLESEENALTLVRKGGSNAIGRSPTGQVCAEVGPSGGFSGYHQDPGGQQQGPACIVDDPSGSDAAQWFGYAAGDRALPMPPPLDPATGQPALDFPGGLQRPRAAAILEVRNGAVFDCAMGGTVFNRTLAMRLSRWYYKLPPPSKPRSIVVKHLGEPVVSLCVAYGDSFQHSALDMIPKLGMLMPFLEKHPKAKLLASRGSRSILELIGVKNPAVYAEPNTVYTAPVVHMMHFHGATPPYIGVAPYGANAAVQDSLLLLQQVPSSFAGSAATMTTILYLSRSGQSMRRVANEAAMLRAVEEALAPGVRLQRFAHESLKADAAQFRAAKVVLGPHGGAFANLIFMAPGAHVVEFLPLGRLLRSGQNPRPCYVYLAHACRLSYWAVEPEDFDFDNTRLDMRVPVGQVLRALGHIGVLRNGAAAAAATALAEEEGENQRGRAPQTAVSGAMRRRRGWRQPAWKERVLPRAGSDRAEVKRLGDKLGTSMLREPRRKTFFSRAGRSRGRGVHQ